MSVGGMHDILDNKGSLINAIDVIISPKVGQRLLQEPGTPEPEHMQFFFELLQNYMQQKFSIQIGNWYTILKQCRYKGTYVQFQRVKVKETPKIKVLDG